MFGLGKSTKKTTLRPGQVVVLAVGVGTTPEILQLEIVKTSRSGIEMRPLDSDQTGPVVRLLKRSAI